MVARADSFRRMPREVPATSFDQPLAVPAPAGAASAALGERKPKARAISSRVGGAPGLAHGGAMKARISLWRAVGAASWFMAAFTGKSRYC